jgi:hypothetical protein
MRALQLWAIALGAVSLTVCSPRSTSQPTPSGGPAPGAPPPQAPPAPAPTPAPMSPGAPAGAPSAGAPRRRVPPNPVVQDSSRRAMVDSILRRIAGHEQEPAGQVFKNVQVLKDLPAGEFLRGMDTNYGRGLGWTCGNCHVIGQFDADTRKNKRIARQMQEMTIYLNTQQLTKVKELDATYDKVTCVTCHRGSNQPKGTMPVPPAPAPVPPPGPGPRS